MEQMIDYKITYAITDLYDIKKTFDIVSINNKDLSIAIEKFWQWIPKNNSKAIEIISIIIIKRN